MKYMQPNIKAEIINLEPDKISYNDVYPQHKWHPEYDVITKVYNDLITEWAKNLYTPYVLLQDSINRIYGNQSSILFRYSLKDIFSIVDVNWNCYKKFKKDAENFDSSRFSIFILYYKKPWNLVENGLSANRISYQTILKIKSLLNKRAFCLKNELSEDGCFIVINGEFIDSYDTDSLEQAIDHEMNHYFHKFSDIEDFDEISLNRKIEKIGSDAGYDLKNPMIKSDFIDHILLNSEFKPMIANVCNILEFKLHANDKYNWLIEHSTSNFLKTDEYRKLIPELQNILLFTTICRAYSLKRWNELKNDLRIQFNKKETFSEKLKCGFMTFIEKIKRLY